MRFLNYPTVIKQLEGKEYIVHISSDPGLETLAPRLGATLYRSQDLTEMKNEQMTNRKMSLSAKDAQIAKLEDKKIATLTAFSLKESEVLAGVNSFGLAALLVMRDTLKWLPYCLLYSAFVLMASFHAANGLWTALITWGVTINQTSQTLFLYLSQGLMGLLAFLGLVAAWGTYWINLYS